MPATTSEILAAVDSLLEPARFEDYCLNGLQVPGPEQVSTLATGVSANAALFELAAAEQADLILVHHGLIWGSGITAIDPILASRLRILFNANIGLAAYHLPLDAHRELGNNALLARALGGEGELEPFALHRSQPIGFIVSLPREGMTASELFTRTKDITSHEPLIFDFGPPAITRLAIVSGGGADYLEDAAAANADCLLTGEASERSMALARELELHLIVAGHYATETFAVRALGEHLAERFDLRHVFLDIPNPI